MRPDGIAAMVTVGCLACGSAAFAQPARPFGTVQAPEGPPAGKAIELTAPVRVSAPATERFTVNPLFRTSDPQSSDGFGPTWRLGLNASYRAPLGFTLSTAVVGRRGYALPLSMAMPGSLETASDVGAANVSSFDWTRHPVLWDTVFRVEKRVISRGDVNLTLAGELFNPMRLNRPVDPAALSGTFTARAFRASAILGF